MRYLIGFILFILLLSPMIYEIVKWGKQVKKIEKEIQEKMIAEATNE